MEKLSFRYSGTLASVLLILPIFTVIGTAAAQPMIKFTSKVTGLSQPMQIVNAGDGSNRLFVAERAGTVKVFNSTFSTMQTYLDISSVVGEDGEGGLLSIAFHPSYETNGFFYVYYTNNTGDLELARYKTTVPSENAADNTSGRILLTIPHPINTNHNGGELHFDNAGNLYLSTGDGGGSNDPQNNAQNLEKHLGKILRIRVTETDVAPYYTIPADNPFIAVSGALPEIFATGLRNPFRWGFDSQTEEMWIGDVGQDAFEEINRVTLAEARGANFGWKCYEGTAATGLSGCTLDPADHTAPVHTYATRSARGNSVVGGLVYRGTNVPSLAGYYIGGDVTSGDVHVIGPVSEGSDFDENESLQEMMTGIVDFGEDENKEVYAVKRTATDGTIADGEIFLIEEEDELPVTLVDFKGILSSEGTLLHWTTAFEKNFRAFEIESSSNLKSFEKIGTVTASVSPAGSAYRFLHAVHREGIRYYRLKMIDTDGTFVHSRYISVGNNSDVSDIFIKPSFINTGNMNVTVLEPYSLLEVLDNSGKVHVKTDISGRSGTIDLPVHQLNSGMYIVRLTSSEKSISQKILVVQ